MKKRKKKSFSVSFSINIDLCVKVKASSKEEAVNLTRHCAELMTLNLNKGSLLELEKSPPKGLSANIILEKDLQPIYE
jgi:hypothetical protein